MHGWRTGHLLSADVDTDTHEFHRANKGVQGLTCSIDANQALVSVVEELGGS